MPPGRNLLVLWNEHNKTVPGMGLSALTAIDRWFDTIAAQRQLPNELCPPVSSEINSIDVTIGSLYNSTACSSQSHPQLADNIISGRWTVGGFVTSRLDYCNSLLTLRYCTHYSLHSVVTILLTARRYNAAVCNWTEMSFVIAV